MRFINSNGDQWDDELDLPISAEETGAQGESVEGVVIPEVVDDAARVRALLGPAQRAMEAAGFYAYITLDQQQRITIASDDEAGRFDIWVEADHYGVSLWASDPGFFMDEENEWRRRAMERLARMQIPRVSQGMLASHQEAMWDDDDRGVAVRLTYRIPLEDADTIGEFVREHISELSGVLSLVEGQIA